MSTDYLLTTDEAARVLGVHVVTVRRWIESGRLPASRHPGTRSYRIRSSDLYAPTTGTTEPDPAA